MLEPIQVGTHLYLYKGMMYVGPSLHKTVVYYNTSSDAASVLPQTSVKEAHPDVTVGGIVTSYVYVNRMKSLQTLTATVGAGDVAVISPRDIFDITVITGLYETAFMYYGAPPREMLPHLTDPVCSEERTVLTVGPGIDVHLNVISATNNTPTPVILTLSRSTHLVAGAGVCGTVQLLLGSNAATSPRMTLWVDCSNAESTSTETTHLSAPLLSLGLHVMGTGSIGDASVCVYRANNNEIDHTTTTAIIFIMGLALSAWIRLTRGLFLRIGNAETEAKVWKRTTVAFAPIVYDVLIVAIGLCVTLAARQSHNVYSFEALQLVSKSTVDAIVSGFAYGVCPTVGGGALFALTVGRILYGNNHPPKTHLLFTWGSLWMERRPIVFRVTVAAIALGCVAGIILGLWVYLISDWRGAIASGVLSFGSFLHVSNPTWVTQHIVQHQEAVRPLLPILLLWLRWGFEFILIITILFYLPVDVNGKISTRFHTSIGIGLGGALLYITGRDFAHILILEKDRLSKLWLTVALVLMLGIGACVVMVVSVFSLGAALVTTEALRNKEETALWSSAAISSVAFVGTFAVWSLSDVGAATVK